MTTGSADHIDQLLGYEAWANARIFAAVKQLPHDRNQRALALLAHIANALRIWHDRFQQLGTAAEPWRELTLEECGEDLRLQHERVATVIRTQRKALKQLVSYRTSEGQQYETPLLDILQHLALHSHYHRGQVNVALREAGGTPVNVDYITFVREGL
jgi:uncharacterized damage-inducible protein DinB